jgi:hypothetical protein
MRADAGGRFTQPSAPLIPSLTKPLSQGEEKCADPLLNPLPEY